MHRLPPETLSTIFQHAGHYEDRMSPPEIHFRTLQAITHVCSHWRMVAMHFASLWSTIYVSNVKVAQMFLERSKSVLLDVHLHDLKPQHDAFLRHILCNMPRFRRLFITCADTAYIARFFPHRQDAAQLVQLGIRSWCAGPLPLFGAPTLSTVYLRSIDFSQRSQLTSLKHLSVGELPERVLMPHFVDLLESNPMLETLEFNQMAIKPQDIERRVPLLSLRQLNISHSTPRTILGVLCLPLSCNLTIEDVDEQLTFGTVSNSIFILALPDDSSFLPNLHGTLRLSIHLGQRGVRAIAAKSSSIVEMASIDVLPRAFAEASLGPTGSLNLQDATEFWINRFCSISNLPDWDLLFESMMSLEALYLCGCACDSILDAIRQNEKSLPRLRFIKIFAPKEVSFESVRLLGCARRCMGLPLNLEIGYRFERRHDSILDGIYDTLTVYPASYFPEMSTSFV